MLPFRVFSHHGILTAAFKEMHLAEQWIRFQASPMLWFINKAEPVPGG